MLLTCIDLKAFTQRSAFATKVEFYLVLCFHQVLQRKDEFIKRPWLRYLEQASQKDAQTPPREDLQRQ